MCEQLAYAILHDASEAYSCDLTTPAKNAIRGGGMRSDFDIFDREIKRRILSELGVWNLRLGVSDSVGVADRRAYVMETWALFPSNYPVEWREKLPGHEFWTKRDILVVPEDDSVSMYHDLVAICLEDEMRSKPAHDLWCDFVAGR